MAVEDEPLSDEDKKGAVEPSAAGLKEAEYARVKREMRAWEAAFARAEAAEAREKAKAAGAPVVAAAVEADVAADRETRLEELRKRARETVRLASQGEEF